MRLWEAVFFQLIAMVGRSWSGGVAALHNLSKFMKFLMVCRTDVPLAVADAFGPSQEHNNI